MGGAGHHGSPLLCGSQISIRPLLKWQAIPGRTSAIQRAHTTLMHLLLLAMLQQPLGRSSVMSATPTSHQKAPSLQPFQHAFGASLSRGRAATLELPEQERLLILHVATTLLGTRAQLSIS